MTRLRDDATEAQVRAADPAGSTWLSANAGSGKTRVLTDRVARLLLRDVDPRQILCLTYTRAAAAEMQNRLFSRLGDWAMRDDESLREALMQLGGDIPADLGRARTLFATAIETPGGLKIQTIHSFCAGLLRRFPLEAGVNPQFEEMEERAADLLRAEIVDAMAEGPEADTVRNVARHFTGDRLDDLSREVARRRDGLARVPTWVETADRFGLDPDVSEDTILADVFLGDELQLLDDIIPPMLEKGGNDAKAAKLLSGISTLDLTALSVLDRCFVVQATGLPKIESFPTKPTREKIAEQLPALNALMERVHAARTPLSQLTAAKKTHALNQFAGPFLARYADAKRQRGWLDYDDLILKTRDLLSEPAVADWVLYRLDGGIGHILLDEAQDTSPAQWDVIRKLAQEFAAGQGARPERLRTIFVVGDKKQSIYSFQGADPDEFDRMAHEFGSKLDAAGQRLASASLEFSFRSSDAILRVVDRTFAHMPEAGFVTDLTHRAFRADMPGRVDLWPVIEAAPDTDDRPWSDPVDRTPSTHHSILLANRIAERIAQMLDPAAPVLIPDRDRPGDPYHMRPVRAGDIMVLMQTRKPLFHHIIRACKARNLPIAGADRLRVGGELAVRDLLALLSFLATPEDSLSLATVLRSPLGEWTEKQLFDLAHDRAETHLWATLRARRDLHADTYAMLTELRGQIDFLRPFDLLERILTRYRGRERLLARLGAEAEDGIDALLSQALAFERSAVPSLTGFLRWAGTDELEIRRQIDSRSDLIRVLTVHGAKGLEAPIVILPDCGQRNLTVKDELLEDEGGILWKTGGGVLAPVVEAALNRRKQAEARERLRLLYVAMTRAETWLIVAAAGELSKDRSDWYQTVESGMEAVGAVPHDFSFGRGLRHEFGDWSLPPAPDMPQSDDRAAPLEPLFRRPVSEMPVREEPLSPSDLGGIKALASSSGLPEPVALARGTYVHNLLEVLANTMEADWDALARSVLPPPDMPSSLAGGAIEEACTVLRRQDLHWIFNPEAMSEVTVTARICDRPTVGTIDRLIFGATTVTAVDYKTNTSVPESAGNCPEGILRQMGAYAAVLAQIYPDRDVETGILWTASARYMPLPPDLVRDALARSPHLDGGRGPS